MLHARLTLALIERSLKNPVIIEFLNKSKTHAVSELISKEWFQEFQNHFFTAFRQETSLTLRLEGLTYDQFYSLSVIREHIEKNLLNF